MCSNLGEEPCVRQIAFFRRKIGHAPQSSVYESHRGPSIYALSLFPLPRTFHGPLSSIGCLRPFALYTLNLDPSNDTMAVPLLASDAIDTDIDLRLVQSRTNPSDCTCGWYSYYSAVCNHQFAEIAHKCGGKTTKTGQARFCGSPAPRHIVMAVKVSQRCPICPNI
jgi:hypothetical protein